MKNFIQVHEVQLGLMKLLPGSVRVLFILQNKPRPAGVDSVLLGFRAVCFEVQRISGDVSLRKTTSEDKCGFR